jgi:ABC-type sugar transport system ATPase subunit
MAVLLISSEIEELLEMADRILVMRGGTIVQKFEQSGLTPEMVLAAALGAGVTGGART